jgi:putative membrane protein
MRRLRCLLLLSAVAFAGTAATPALAHEAHRAGAAQDAGGAGEVLVPGLAIVLAACLLARGYGRLAGRSPGATVGRPQATMLVFAIVALAVTLSPPVDATADALFSAHMGQHLSLILLIAPLLALGRGGLVSLAGLPERAGRTLGRMLARARVASLLRGRAGALAAWTAFCGVFAFWHVPGPYRWSLVSPVLHEGEHVMLLLSAYAFWSVIFARRDATIGYGERLLSLSTAAVLSGLPGALMILTQRRFYPVGDDLAAWGLTPVEDQQLAGLVMWIPGSFVFLAAITWLAFMWMQDAGRRAWSARPLASGLALAVLMPILLGLAACSPQAEAGTGQDAAAAGARVIAATGCGTCHVIPGIEGANGVVGPPLTQVGRRVFLAGLLRNTPDNMAYWLRRPQAVVPGNAMPDTGLSAEEARQVTAYLATLR